MTEMPAVPARVSTLELFFDLVFVFTITEVSSIIVRAPHPAGVAQAALTLSVIFWMYAGFAWLTNSAQPDTPIRRGVLFAAMAAFFICSLAVPTAFGTSGLAFGLAYLAINLIHAAGFVIYAGRAALAPVARLLAWNLVSAGLLLAAAWAHGDTDWILWGLAVCVQLVTPLAIRVGQNFSINAAHFGERHGLVILIVLGESLVSVGLASEHERVGLRLALGVSAGLVAAATMWWMYFAADDEMAADAMQRARPAQRPVWAVTGYFFAHFLMIFGILAVAAGTRLSVDDLLAPTGRAAAWLIACGAGLYAAGSAAFRLALHFAPALLRALAAPACLIAVAAGRHGSAAAELTAVAGVLAVALLAERWLGARPGAPTDEPSERMTA